MEQWISSLQPLHWLAIAIFFGCAILAALIDNLARALKKQQTFGKSDEAKAIEDVAQALFSIRNYGLEVKPKANP